MMRTNTAALFARDESERELVRTLGLAITSNAEHIQRDDARIKKHTTESVQTKIDALTKNLTSCTPEKSLRLERAIAKCRAWQHRTSARATARSKLLASGIRLRKQLKRVKRDGRAYRERTAATSMRAVKCTHSPMVHGPTTANTLSTVQGQLVCTRALCDTCQTAVEVTVLSVGVICSICQETIGQGCSEPENYREEIDKHATTHGKAVVPCPFGCGTMHTGETSDAHKHWVACTHNPRNSAEIRSTATQSGTNGANQNIIWIETPSGKAAGSTCTDCKHAARMFDVVVENRAVVLRCTDCTTVSCPTSPVNVPEPAWGHMLIAPERPTASRVIDFTL
jgi:hypothetical protein